MRHAAEDGADVAVDDAGAVDDAVVVDNAGAVDAAPLGAVLVDALWLALLPQPAATRASATSGGRDDQAGSAHCPQANQIASLREPVGLGAEGASLVGRVAGSGSDDTTAAAGADRATAADGARATAARAACVTAARAACATAARAACATGAGHRPARGGVAEVERLVGRAGGRRYVGGLDVGRSGPPGDEPAVRNRRLHVRAVAEDQRHRIHAGAAATIRKRVGAAGVRRVRTREEDVAGGHVDRRAGRVAGYRGERRTLDAGRAGVGVRVDRERDPPGVVRRLPAGGVPDDCAGGRGGTLARCPGRAQPPLRQVAQRHLARSCSTNRPTEVDAQLGIVVALGAEAGVATPLTAHLVELIHKIERGTRPLSLETLDALAVTPTQADRA